MTDGAQHSEATLISPLDRSLTDILIYPQCHGLHLHPLLEFSVDYRTRCGSGDIRSFSQ